MAAEGEWEEVAEEPDADTGEVYEGETAEAEPEPAGDFERPPRYGREPPRAVGRPDRSVVIIPYLWMLDDLRIRPRFLRKSHARFIAGPLIGVLAIVLFGLFTLAAGNLFLIILSVAVLGLTQACVALFLYSMLWQE